MLSSRQDEFSGMMEYYILTHSVTLIPFSYVHNNFAGFFRESWVQFILMSGQRRLLFRLDGFAFAHFGTGYLPGVQHFRDIGLIKVR